LRRFGDREVRLTQTIRDLRPDAIVFTGDIIDRAENLALLESFLAALGPAPRVAVLGNWEYWSTVDLQRLRSIYEATPNSALLVNQRAALTLNGRELEFVGLDDFTAGKPDTRLLRSQTSSAVRVVLQHAPGLFGELNLPANRQNQICLSGHTHGGQVSLFGRPFWTPRGSGRFVAGWYETPSCRLYVSRGVGMSILPIRFGARPEVAVFEF
jgi:predicted MPP superfamily phosphohydrolase